MDAIHIQDKFYKAVKIAAQRKGGSVIKVWYDEDERRWSMIIAPRVLVTHHFSAAAIEDTEVEDLANEIVIDVDEALNLQNTT